MAPRPILSFRICSVLVLLALFISTIPAAQGQQAPAQLKLQFPGGANGQVGTPYSSSLSATGGIAPYKFAISAGTLPASLTLNPATGAITGTPTAVVQGAAANLTATVTDSTGASATANGTINIQAPAQLKLQFPGGANGQVGTPYGSSLSATGGLAPYTFAISAGTLPAGLTLNPATGAITGTPTAVVQGAAANLTAKAVDSTGASATANGTINIAPAPVTLVSIAVTPASVSLGRNGTQQYTATGTYSDNSTQNLTNSVAWTSGSPSIVSVSGTGLATVLGTSTSAISITATSGTIVSPPSWLSALSTLPVVCPTPTIDMKLLVVTNGQTEADFPAITQILDYLGTPYTVLDFSAQTAGVTPSMLSDGSCHGYYQGVIFTTGGYIYTLPGMATLTSYEQTFGVRQVNWFTDPTPDFGLNFTSNTVASTSTYSASFSAVAAPIFSYANTATALSISNAFIYLTTPVASTALPAGSSVTPLLTDAKGNALSAIYSFGDGRQYLTQTFDSNPYLTHDLVLAYGLVNWVTKGIFLGQYHVYAAAQVDDFFINDSEWIPGTPCTDPITHDRTAPDASSLPVFRLTYSDMSSLVTWQSTKQKDPLLSNFKLTLAFNGVGTTGNPDWTGLPTAGVASDTLVAQLNKYEQFFHWISHTYNHPTTLNGLLKSSPTGDIYNNPPTDDIDLEVLTNLYVANSKGGVNLDTDPSDTALKQLKFTDFNPANMVTPGVTGLNDTEVPVYLYQNGIRNVVSDTSVIGQPNNGPNPSPNVGIVNSYEPGIYEVPRHPNDVFYNTANWADEQAEFNCLYTTPPYANYNALQILDFVSSSFVTNMLIGDMDPQMFHQPNLHFSDNATNLGLAGSYVSSLISDTYDMTFSKYEALYKLPVLSLTLDQMAAAMQARNAYNLAGVTASLIGVGGAAPTISITAPLGAASIPVTGLNSAGAESYGAQHISYVTVNAGQTVTLSVQ